MNEKIMYELDCGNIWGLKSTLFVYEDKVVIDRKYEPGIILTILSFGLNKIQMMRFVGVKTIYISDITSVTFKKGDSTWGQLGLFRPGGDLVTDGVAFRKESNDKAEEIANYINASIKKLKSAETSSAIDSTADEIRKLKTLLDEGIISQEEFDSKKKQLLT